MSKAQQIYDEVASGSPRSAEFLAGVHYILMLKLDGVSFNAPLIHIRVPSSMPGCGGVSTVMTWSLVDVNTR